MHLTRRALAVSAMALAALTTASGCTATNAQQTAEQYAPGAAAATTVGAVHVGGLFVATGGEGPAALVARLVNSTDEAASVQIRAVDGADLGGEFTVEPGTTLDIGPGGEQVRAASFDVPPGGVIDMEVSSDGASNTLAVPVLDGTLEQYAQYVPTATPTTSPTPLVTSSPTASGTRTGTPSPTDDDAEGGATPSRTPSPGATPTDDES